MNRRLHITFTGRRTAWPAEDTSISVSIVPDSAISLYYEYGTTSGVYTGQTATSAAVAGQPKVVVISGLAANTKYYYRMQYSTDGRFYLDSHEPNTLFRRNRCGSTFKFDVTSDSHVGMQSLATLPRFRQA